jgi:hypothetical protein
MDVCMSGLEPVPAGSEPGPTLGWAAGERLHRYLESFGLPHGEQREALVLRFVGEAMDRGQVLGRDDLARRALKITEQELAAWFGRVLDEALPEGQQPLLLGRAAFLLCGGATRWPGALLSENPPADFVDALRVAMPAPTPPEEQGAMVEQEFESWSLRDLAPSRLARAALGFGGRQAVTS